MKGLKTWDWPQTWYLGPSNMALSIPLGLVTTGALGGTHQAASHHNTVRGLCTGVLIYIYLVMMQLSLVSEFSHHKDILLMKLYITVLVDLFLVSLMLTWYYVLSSHTRPGSVKTCIYEGAKSFFPSNTSAMDLNQLTQADIVLTTYDVLKEDLSHDSDRHDGDRRCMRFQKRFRRPSVLLLLLMSFMNCSDRKYYLI